MNDQGRGRKEKLERFCQLGLLGIHYHQQILELISSHPAISNCGEFVNYLKFEIKILRVTDKQTNLN